MSTDLLKDIIPTFLETIAFPLIIFATLLSFLDIITTIVANEGAIITYQVVTDFHDHLVNITDLTIRYSEATLSVSDSYPAISISQAESRYENLISLHTNVENIFQQIINLQSLLEGNATLDMTTAQRNELISVIDMDCERFRLAGNILMKSIRIAERILRTNDPSFVTLDPQWFED